MTTRYRRTIFALAGCALPASAYACVGSDADTPVIIFDPGDAAVDPSRGDAGVTLPLQDTDASKTLGPGATDLCTSADLACERFADPTSFGSWSKTAESGNVAVWAADQSAGGGGALLATLSTPNGSGRAASLTRLLDIDAMARFVIGFQYRLVSGCTRAGPLEGFGQITTAIDGGANRFLYLREGRQAAGAMELILPAPPSANVPSEILVGSFAADFWHAVVIHVAPSTEPGASDVRIAIDGTAERTGTTSVIGTRMGITFGLASSESANGPCSVVIDDIVVKKE